MTLCRSSISSKTSARSLFSGFTRTLGTDRDAERQSMDRSEKSQPETHTENR
ncbi:hypothetical protein GGQ74_002820 [Desulfobaculum xiamenense]|uniref:Uncharacterized protein n=1 Tax=Desulfobaculum xiamenense TaxID=995050 RepID=A0A846QJR1_9BACT|nr:hypothetical protein [Desulfobaculum xiamenense]NJB69126.1 hypothetical protein [Desulfobaculum xiamenense]